MNQTKYLIKVPGFVDGDDLDQLVNSMERIFNTTIETKTETSLETPSKGALDALQTIFRSANGNGIHPDAKPIQETTKGKQGGGVRSWTVVATGDKISTQALNKAIAEKEIDLGTKLHHPKHGDRVVMQTAEGAYDLADPGKWTEPEE